MFANDLVLDDKSGDDVTYRLYRSDGNGTSRIDVATTLAAPGVLNIKHQTQGKGAATVDRHLVQLSRTVMDANGVAVTATVNVSLAVPRNAAITNQLIYDMVVNVVDFLVDGQLTSVTATTNLDALLRGES